MKTAMDEIYERVPTLNGILNTAQKHPSLLIEVLESTVQEQPFFAFVDQISSDDSPHAFYHSCLESIHKQNLQGRRIDPFFPSTTSNVMISKCSKGCCTSHSTYTALISENNQLSERPNVSGRKYALPKRTIKFRKTNPVSENGKFMLCGQCGSPEHLIRDFLKAKRAALVSIVLDGSLEIGEIPTDLSTDEIMDVYQNHQMICGWQFPRK